MGTGTGMITFVLAGLLTGVILATVTRQGRLLAACLSLYPTTPSMSRRSGVDAEGGGTARRLRVGLKAGPGTAARLGASNCGEGLACLFQVCAVLPHQACADGSVFFRRQLSKAGLSGPAGQPAARAQPDARHGIVGPRSPKGAAGPKPADKPMRHAMGRPKEAWAPARRIR